MNDKMMSVRMMGNGRTRLALQFRFIILSNIILS